MLNDKFYSNNPRTEDNEKYSIQSSVLNFTTGSSTCSEHDVCYLRCVSASRRKILLSPSLKIVILICTSAQLFLLHKVICRLINSHLQAYSLQAKSQVVVHTLGSQCVYISEIFKPYHLPRRVKLAKRVTNWLKYI